jgi:YidC/Oxa1 family membrane protein insertase
MMNKLALYVFPLGVVVGGPFLPLAIILYWVSNNIWTYGQQHLVFGRIEKEEEAKKQEELARRASNAPAPGTKPKRKRPTTSGAGAESPTKPPVELTDHDGDEIGADDAGSTDATSAPLGDSPPTSNGKGPATKAGGGANRGPRRANSRPKKRRP